MKNVINYENIRYYCYTNADLIKGEVKGIVLTFHGLGFDGMFDTHPDEDYADGRHGIIEIVPYYNPWCWMNKQTVDYVDELIDVIKDHFGLDDNVKITASGGSMGGLCALLFTYYSKHKPQRCVANCPVCDTVYHYTERPDLPRTLYSAYGNLDMSLEDALAMHSPYHLAEKMPDVEYVVFHCTADDAVNYEKHGVKFVNKMKECGKKIEFITVPDRGHCDLGDFRNDYFNQIRVGMG